MAPYKEPTANRVLLKFLQSEHILFCHSGVSFYSYIDILVYILFIISSPNQNANL